MSFSSRRFPAMASQRRSLARRLLSPRTWITIVLVGWACSFLLDLEVPPQVYMGVPRATEWAQPKTWTRVLRNRGFTVGYSELRGNPLWVTYALRYPAEIQPHGKRPSRFGIDRRSLLRVGHADYAGSGYDRGHMAPNHAIASLYGRQAQWDTFLMTNISPQKPNLDRRLWERLEEVELDHFARRFGSVWVVTGPLFGASPRRLPSTWRVEIPEAFYKIIVAPAQRQALAFIMPQSVEGDEPLDRYLTSVDAVEKRTGLDFFHELDDALEEVLESSDDPAPWHLTEVAHLPAHFSPAALRKRSEENGGSTWRGDSP